METGAREIPFDRIDVATSFMKRLVGLMGKKEVEQGYCLVFPKCNSVHGAFMSVPVDVAYLDAEDRVIGVETLRPWKLGHAPRGTKSVIECRQGTLEKEAENIMGKKLAWR